MSGITEIFGWLVLMLYIPGGRFSNHVGTLLYGGQKMQQIGILVTAKSESLLSPYVPPGLLYCTENVSHQGLFQSISSFKVVRLSAKYT